MCQPTRSDVRDWWIPMFDDKSPWWVYILASIPALLLTILLFMDQQITSVIVNRKEHKLKVSLEQRVKESKRLSSVERLWIPS